GSRTFGPARAADYNQHHTPPFNTRNHLSFRALPPSREALENPRVGSSTLSLGTKSVFVRGSLSGTPSAPASTSQPLHQPLPAGIGGFIAAERGGATCLHGSLHPVIGGRQRLDEASRHRFRPLAACDVLA